MKEHDTFPGNSYFVTCKVGCTITDASGELKLTCEPGHQQYVNAPSDKLYTSEDAVVRKANFNYALAALGLLGGGVSELPTGYIRALFLESTGTQYMDSGIAPKSGLSYHVDFQGISGVTAVFGVQDNSILTNAGVHITQRFTNADCVVWRHLTRLSFKMPKGSRKLVEYNDTQLKVDGELTSSYEYAEYDYTKTAYLFSNHFTNFIGRIYSCSIKTEVMALGDFVPSVNSEGVPCMYDKVSKHPLINDGSGAFIVGFTLKQARQLSKLPAGGGELTISLPSNWQEDAAVVDALATAEGNGWVLPIQTYEAEAGAVSTFALRRIWVRKRAEQNGTYVAADGARWQVEWCATMVGGDPQEHGYEPFRSVEAAAVYWELLPYVYPEAEQLLTD